MVEYNDVIKQNEQVKELVQNPVGVFVGGTSGIGEHTAYLFARYTSNPTIYIVGRNKTAADTILAKIKQLNPNATSYFLQHDLQYIEQAERVANILLNHEDKINFLLLGCGDFSVSGRTETDEGIDKFLSLSYYTRWCIADRVIRLLDNAASRGEPARVVSALSAGTESSVELDNLDLKTGYTFVKAMKVGPTYNSLAALRFAKLHPNVSFVHAFPGLTRTNVFRELPWYLSPLKLTLFFYASPETVAQKFFYLGYSGREYATGAHLVDQNLNSTREAAEEKGYLTPELQETVWTHTLQVLKDALAHDKPN